MEEIITNSIVEVESGADEVGEKAEGEGGEEDEVERPIFGR